MIHLIMAAFFALLGILFSRGKGASLIAGYNTASAQEKAATDEKKLCRFMSRLMFALGGCWLIAAVGEFLGVPALLWIAIALFLVIAITGAIWANTGNRFQKNTDS